MSTTTKLHIRTNDMDDEMLKNEGYFDTGLNSLLLKSNNETPDEWYELLDETDTFEVGVNNGIETLEDEIVGYLNVVTEIDENMIEEVQQMVTDYQRDDGIVEWLKNHEGNEVFAVSW